MDIVRFRQSENKVENLYIVQFGYLHIAPGMFPCLRRPSMRHSIHLSSITDINLTLALSLSSLAQESICRVTCALKTKSCPGPMEAHQTRLQPLSLL